MSENKVCNYCASFIDLLGQQESLKGQDLMPDIRDDEVKKQFFEQFKKSVGAIVRLQEQASTFRKGYSKPFPTRDLLTDKEKLIYDEMKNQKPKQQRWSDGLVYFSPLDTESSPCPMNAVFEIFGLSGALCFIGIANGQPIRGAIEISWGTELHENELYGAVVKNCYELESKIAQSPRIVVGQHTIGYLNAHLKEEIDEEDNFALYNRSLAEICLKMIAVDQDGYHVLDYLGNTFTATVVKEQKAIFYQHAYSFICNEYEKHFRNKNSKLAIRYAWLKGYYDQNSIENIT